jgi:hypothetical protein
LASIKKAQLAVLDGAEWNSVQSILKEEKRFLQQSSSAATTPMATTKYGYMKVVAGRDAENRRVVGMQCMGGNGNDNESVVYQDSIAVIPDKVSDTDAISTYISSLSAVHCAVPKCENVGGGDDSITTGKVVVLGSSDLACFAAEGLASLGVEVYMINNKGNANVKKNVGKSKFLGCCNSSRLIQGRFTCVAKSFQ